MILAISIAEYIMLMGRVKACSVKELFLLLERGVQVHQDLMNQERNQQRHRTLHFIAAHCVQHTGTPQLSVG